jgi:ABC-type antimicrobial peptide transport system permease subunit
MDKPVLLVYQDEAARFGLHPGDKVSLTISGGGIGQGQGGLNLRGSSSASSSGQVVEFEVIGIIQPVSTTIQFERGWVAPYKIVNQAGINISFFYMLVDRAQIKTTLTKVQSLLVGGFVFDLGDLIDTFSKILDQILAFPLLLSLLSLFSGAILIANNVALAMLERRTEIGVLKAIGAKRRRVLNMLLWESSLVGLLGGLIGVGTGIGLALLIPVLVNATSRGSRAAIISITWSPLTALLLLALGAGLAIVATLISAWGAVQEKPLVVLRYE